MGLLATASVAIDGSKFKAVNNRDKNFTKGKVERRRAQLEESVARYLAQLDTIDRQEPTEALAAKTKHLKEKLVKLKCEMDKLGAYERQMLTSPDQQISLTDPDSRSMATSGRGSGVVGYNVQVAVETENHLIVTHEVTSSGFLVSPAQRARPDVSLYLDHLTLMAWISRPLRRSDVVRYREVIRRRSGKTLRAVHGAMRTFARRASPNSDQDTSTDVRCLALATGSSKNRFQPA